MIRELMDSANLDLRVLLQHRDIDAAAFVAPTILRLAKDQNAQRKGQTEVEVSFRSGKDDVVQTFPMVFRWSVAGLDAEFGCSRFREELKKLRKSKNEHDITELAAYGVAFALPSALLPDDRVSRVVQVGGKGDFYLNDVRLEMIEIGGTLRGDVAGLFARKRKQILANARLTRAFVSVTRFDPLESRLERVR